MDADYARATILYIHLNPRRAGLCESVGDYNWTSHSHYCECISPADGPVHAQLGLRLFANTEAASSSQQYLHYLDYQLTVDACLQSGAGIVCEPPPPCYAGDQHWAEEYAACVMGFEKPRAAVSMYDVATHLLLRLDAKCPLDLVRSGTRARRVSHIRKQLIAALLVQGFRGHMIARFFGVSSTAVSRIAISLPT